MITRQLIRELAEGLGISLHDAAQRFPPNRRRKGKPAPVSPSCVWRWSRDGVRGANGAMVKLEAAKAGKRTLTTPAAIERFLERLNPSIETTQPRTQSDRTDAATKAKRELARVGIG